MSKKQQKINKKEQRKIQKERDQRMKLIRTWGPAIIIIVGIIVFAIVRVSSQREVDGVTKVAAATSNLHDANVTFPFEDYPLPPLGGPHNPTWQRCGIYDTPVESQYAVHAMEHGAIWVTYNPDLPEDQINALQDEVRGDSYIILSPYPDQTSPIALSAWDRQLTVESASDNRIGQFITAYRRARGPERAATCNTGVGAPIG